MTRVVPYRAVVAAVVAAFAIPARADDAHAPWIVEPTPEAADAVQLGAAEVEQAQQLAKKKQFLDAVAVLEHVARTWPAAVHDCNLSLAYLRAGALTRAQLMWDVAGLRNAGRPSWCTGGLSTQLSKALHAAGYVPLTIDVVPADAVISVGGVEVRDIHTLWLPPGPIAIAASAPGRIDNTQQITIVAPSARVGISLAAVGGDAAAPTAPVTQPRTASDLSNMDIDSGTQPSSVPAKPSIAVTAEPSRTPIYAGLAVTGVTLITGIAFHAAALGARNAGNDVLATSTAFASETSRFDRDRDLALTSYGISVVAAGITVWWWLAHRDHETAPGVSAAPISIEAHRDGAVLTMSWGLP